MRVADITSMEPPKNVGRLRQFLGLVTHVGWYLPSFSNALQPLNKLLKSESEWFWRP